MHYSATINIRTRLVYVVSIAGYARRTQSSVHFIAVYSLLLCAFARGSLYTQRALLP